jgi:hypothetical protein
MAKERLVMSGTYASQLGTWQAPRESYSTGKSPWLDNDLISYVL